MKRARVATIALLSVISLAASGALTGCFNGPQATTTLQANQPTGSGADVSIGDIRVQNVLLVASAVEAASSDGGLTVDENVVMIGRVFNDSTAEDTLSQVTIDGVPAALMVPATGGNPLVIPALDSVPLTYPSGGPGVVAQTPMAVSTYVPVQMFFERAGLVEFEALVVPRTGIYADVPTG